MTRLKKYYASETAKMLSAFEQFSMLLPSATHSGAAHAPEEGRFVESILRATLARHLPTSVEVLTGFIVDPNPKLEMQSPQLDILVFDASRYPKYEQFENTVIVPKEGVLAVISVKKKLLKAHLADECTALREVGNLCGASGDGNPPFLALVGFATDIDDPLRQNLFDCIEDAYPVFEEPYSNNELIELVTVIQKGWSIRKQHRYIAPHFNALAPRGGGARPPATARTVAQYHYFRHEDGEDDLSLQFLLRGILKVFYGRSASTGNAPIKTVFEPGRAATRANIGRLAYLGENRRFLLRREDRLLAASNGAAHAGHLFLQKISAAVSPALPQAEVVSFTAPMSLRSIPVDFGKSAVRIDFGKARRVAERFGLPAQAYVDTLYLFQMAKQRVDTLCHPGGSTGTDLWAQAVKLAQDARSPLTKAICDAATVFALAASRHYAASILVPAAAPAAATSAATSGTAVAATSGTTPAATPAVTTLQPAWDAYIVAIGAFRRVQAAYTVPDVSPARLLSGLVALLAPRPGLVDADSLATDIRALLKSDLR